MQCKYCFAELEEGVSVCPLCGKDLTEETAEPAVEETAEILSDEMPEETPAPKKKSGWWKIALAVVGVVVLAVVLTGVILNSMGMMGKVTTKLNNTFHSLKFWRENDIHYKINYTTKDEKVEENVDTVVATAGNQTLTSGELQAFYWMTVYDFLDYYGYYLDSIGVDITVPLSEQVYDEATGMTYQQMFLDNALKSWHRYAVLLQLSQDDSFTLTQEQQAEMDAFKTRLEELCEEYKYTDIEEFVDKEFFPGSSLEAYLKYNRVSFTALAYYDTLYESLMPTDAELEAYFTEHEGDFAENNKIGRAHV